MSNNTRYLRTAVFTDESDLSVDEHRILNSFMALAEQSSDIVFGVSVLGNRFFYLNSAITAHLGYRVEEALDLPPRTFITETSINELRDLINRTIASQPGGSPELPIKPFQVQLLTRERRPIRAHISLVLMLQHDHRVETISGIARIDPDFMNSHEGASENEIRYRELFENIQVGCVVFDPVLDGKDFVVRDMNRAAESSENVRRQEVTGKSLQEVFPMAEKSGVLDVLVSVMHTGRGRFHSSPIVDGDSIAGWREHFIYQNPSGELVVLYEDVKNNSERGASLGKIENQYRVLCENIPDMVLRIDSSGAILYIKKDMESVVSGSVASGELCDIYSLPIGDEDRTALRSCLQRSFECRTVQNLNVMMSYGGISRPCTLRIAKETGNTAVVLISAAMDTQDKIQSVENVPPRISRARLLIMDDEDILLDIAKQMCIRLGIDADTVSNGTDAVKLYKTHFRTEEAYDAVLLDMTIAGGVGGVEAAAQMRQIDSNVKAVVMSGYSDHEVMGNPGKFGFVAIMSKPFRLSEFTKILKDVLPPEKFNPSPQVKLSSAE